MARVPTTDTFQVVPQAQAKAVEFVQTPYEDNAHTKLARLSDEYNRFALRIQDQQDKARVTQQITDYQRFLNEQTYGDSGYQQLKEGDALAPDKEGRSLTQRYSDTAREYAASLKANMTPRQQQLFDEQAAPLDTSYQRNMLAYTMQEGEKYDYRTFEGALDTQAELGAAQPQDIELTTSTYQRGLDTVRDYGTRHGWSKEAMDAKTLEFGTKFHSGVLARLLDMGASNARFTQQAKAYYDLHRQELTATQSVQFGQLIEEQQTTQRISALANGIYMNGVAETDTGYRLGLAFDASARGGMKVSASGKVSASSKSAKPSNNAAFSDRPANPEQEDVVNNSTDMLPIDVALGMEKAKSESMGKRFTEDDRSRVIDQYNTSPAYQRAISGQYFNLLLKGYGDPEAAIAARLLGKNTVDNAFAAAKKEGDPSKTWQDYLSDADKARMPQVQRIYQRFSAAQEITGPNGAPLSKGDPDRVFGNAGLLKAPSDAEILKLVYANDPRSRGDINRAMGRMAVFKAAFNSQVAQAKERLAEQMNAVEEELRAAGGDVTKLSTKSRAFLASNPAFRDDAEAKAAQMRRGGLDTDYERLFDLTQPDAMRMMGQQEFMYRLNSCTSDQSEKTQAIALWKKAQGQLRRDEQAQLRGGWPEAISNATTLPQMGELLREVDPSYMQIKEVPKRDAYALSVTMGFRRWLTSMGIYDPKQMDKANGAELLKQYMNSVPYLGVAFRGDETKPVALATWAEVKKASTQSSSDIAAMVKALVPANVKPGEVPSEATESAIYHELVGHKTPNLKIEFATSKMGTPAFTRSKPVLRQIEKSLRDTGRLLPGEKLEDKFSPAEIMGMYARLMVTKGSGDVLNKTRTDDQAQAEAATQAVVQQHLKQMGLDTYQGEETDNGYGQ